MRTEKFKLITRQCLADRANLVLKGVPAAATIDDLPNEVTGETVTLKWDEPQNNGEVIRQYTVYQRIVTNGKPGEWMKLKTDTVIAARELKVQLEQDKVYEFVVTATNELGESLKEDGKILRLVVKAFGGMLRGMLFILKYNVFVNKFPECHFL